MTEENSEKGGKDVTAAKIIFPTTMHEIRKQGNTYIYEYYSNEILIHENH
jgi:hypothetical protein